MGKITGQTSEIALFLYRGSGGGEVEYGGSTDGKWLLITKGGTSFKLAPAGNPSPEFMP